MRDHVRIKQILPITDGCTVLSLVEDDVGNRCFEDLSKEGWHYLFALVDGGEWDDDYVAIYEMDSIGCGEIDSSSFRIVPKCTCPKCGGEMTPRWYENASKPSYTCACGAMSMNELFKGGKSK